MVVSGMTTGGPVVAAIKQFSIHWFLFVMYSAGVHKQKKYISNVQIGQFL